MGAINRIKVLIIDDSVVSREIISRGLSMDEHIEVCGTAADPYEAKIKIAKFNPDVITLDLNMPKMNGLAFLKRLMVSHPLPVIIISSATDKVFDALDAGAVDFVSKPEVKEKKDILAFIKEVISKIKVASKASLKTCSECESKKKSHENEKESNNIKVIAIGASTGGTEAILNILKQIPSNVPGILVVQHMPEMFTEMYAKRLNLNTGFNVKEAKTGDVVVPGSVLVAPGNYHMKLKKLGSRLSVECIRGEKVSGHCPSVNVLFESVAKQVGKASIGVILTGMGSDGAQGILKMKKEGAETIGQDEASSVVYGMPKSAYELGAINYQLPLDKIPEKIISLLKIRT